MRTITILLAMWVCFRLQAQTSAQPNPSTEPAPTPYTVVSRTANSAIWQRTTYERAPDGSIVPHIHRYVELASGLNHLIAGNWVPSSDQIEISSDGTSASATNGQAQAYFPGNIYNGAIKLVTPDGKTLESQPIGLGYSDGSNSVLLAVVTNATGAILPSGNQVIYTNAFAGLDADLLYTYTKAGFQQDVVLREQPPGPGVLGLNPAKTRLQIITEFVSSPAPRITTQSVPTAAGNLEDDTLGFGAMSMGQGKAFLVGNKTPSAVVEKHWLAFQGRQFLIEEVPLVSVAKAIDSLQPFVGQAQSGRKPLVSKNLIPPLRRLGHSSPKTTFLAKATPANQGLVLDYQVLNGGVTNYDFRGDCTYYISGPTYLYGTNTFEGGAVIKYTNSASLDLPYESGAAIQSLTAAYRPVIFTSMCDNSVGETISGSTGNPTNYYDVALSASYGTSVSLHNFRIAYAQTALDFYQDNVIFHNGQLVNCNIGCYVSWGEVTFENCLFANITTDFSTAEPAGVIAQHTTLSGSSYLLKDSTYYGNVVLTNCILADVTNLIDGPSASFSGDYNGFYNCPEFGSGALTNNSYPFQAVGGGDYYLANGCVFTNAGTTNIDPTLLVDLQTKTTQPPTILSNISYTTMTNWPTTVQRDTDAPDLGYHYDALDYLVNDVALKFGATLNLANGLAVGVYGDWGFDFEGGNLTSQGTPFNFNHLTRYQLVQEQPVTLPGGTPNALFYAGLSYSGPVTQFRFTDFSAAGSSSLGLGQWLGWNTNFTYLDGADIQVRDCSLHNLGISFPQVNDYDNHVTFINNAFNRCDVVFTNTQSSIGSLYQFFWNNLFRHGSLTVGNSSYNPYGVGVHLFNNLFDNVVLWGTNAISGYNAYGTNLTMLGGSSGGDLWVTNFDYQTGPLGGYYYPTNGGNLSSLINAGSTNASALGLYHYTVTTNQVVEGTNTVSIGYHYVALDKFGNLLDSNGDGVPDYLEDANGDGIYDSGDLGDWQNLNLNVIITQPRNGSLLP